MRFTPMPSDPHRHVPLRAFFKQTTATSNATNASKICAGSTPAPAANRSMMRSTDSTPKKPNTAVRTHQRAFISAH